MTATAAEPHIRLLQELFCVNCARHISHSDCNFVNGSGLITYHWRKGGRLAKRAWRRYTRILGVLIEVQVNDSDIITNMVARRTIAIYLFTGKDEQRGLGIILFVDICLSNCLDQAPERLLHALSVLHTAHLRNAEAEQCLCRAQPSCRAVRPYPKQSPGRPRHQVAWAE